MSPVKANEHQASSVSVSLSWRWKLEGRADWLSLVGGDQSTLIDSPIRPSPVAKVVSPNKTGCHCSKKGEHILGRQAKINTSPLKLEGSWIPRHPKMTKNEKT